MQLSKEDRGRNSSYCVVNSRGQLNLIFNENISANTNVIQYKLTAEGELDRKSLFNSRQEEVMLIPNEAQQVSGNELVIPSLYRNQLAFVKITY